MTEKFCADYSSNVHHIEEIAPLVRDIWDQNIPRHCREHGLEPDEPLTFLLLAKIKGRFPSKRMQFCTEMLKLRPERRWIYENVKGDYELYSGIRADEPGRSAAPLQYWDSFFDCRVNNIVLAWKKEWCFEYVTTHGEEYNPLYKLGFDRVGCDPCINLTKESILTWADRCPESVPKVRAWEQETGWTFFAPKVPGMTKNFIDDVIAWARTDRGGVQNNIFKVLADRPSCESKYGICE